MNLPLCGSGWTLCILVLPRDVPIPHGAQKGPGGLGCIRRCMWVAGPRHTSFSHGASLSPKRPKQDRGGSGVFTSVWERLDPVHTSFSHGASLSPKRPRQDRGDSGVSASMWEWLDPTHPIGLCHLREAT